MKVSYIHHSGFLVETEQFYYLFDYESGALPEMEAGKPIFVLSSHSHADHYNPLVFSLLENMGMRDIRPVLSHDIQGPEIRSFLSVSPGKEYSLAPQVKLTTFSSTDLGVAFLIEEPQGLFYHAGDLNDWVWEEETEDYNREMTANYRREIRHLAETLQGRTLDTAFVVLDPRQEADYDRGLCFFLENIPVKEVFPMHYWDQPAITETFLNDHPEYKSVIRKTQ